MSFGNQFEIIQRSKEVLESKQVGVIYHFTTLDSLFNMTSKDFTNKYGIEYFEFLSFNTHISCTRNYCLSTDLFNKTMNPDKYNVRIALDGNKMSTKFKIKPVLGLIHSDSSIFGTELNHLRVSKHEHENEEVVINNGKRFLFKDYILGIDLYRVPQVDIISEINKHLAKNQVKIDFPIRSVRHYDSYNKNHRIDETQFNIIL